MKYVFSTLELEDFAGYSYNKSNDDPDDTSNLAVN
jgi:hypothetical protein